MDSSDSTPVEEKMPVPRREVRVRSTRKVVKNPELDDSTILDHSTSSAALIPTTPTPNSCLKKKRKRDSMRRVSWMDHEHYDLPLVSCRFYEKVELSDQATGEFGVNEEEHDDAEAMDEQDEEEEEDGEEEEECNEEEQEMQPEESGEDQQAMTEEEAVLAVESENDSVAPLDLAGDENDYQRPLNSLIAVEQPPRRRSAIAAEVKMTRAKKSPEAVGNERVEKVKRARRDSDDSAGEFGGISEEVLDVETVDAEEEEEQEEETGQKDEHQIQQQERGEHQQIMNEEEAVPDAADDLDIAAPLVIAENDDEGLLASFFKYGQPPRRRAAIAADFKVTKIIKGTAAVDFVKIANVNGTSIVDELFEKSKPKLQPMKRQMKKEDCKTRAEEVEDILAEIIPGHHKATPSKRKEASKGHKTPPSNRKETGKRRWFDESEDEEESAGKRQKEEKKESVLGGGIEGLDGVTLGSKAASRRATRAIMATQQKNQKEEEEEVGLKKKPRRNRVRLGTGTAKNEVWNCGLPRVARRVHGLKNHARTMKEEEMEEEDEELSMDIWTGMKDVERGLENEGREPESQEERGALADVEGMQKMEMVEKKRNTLYEQSRDSLQKTLFNLATRRNIRPQQQSALRPSHQNNEKEMESTNYVRVKVNVKSRNIFVFPNFLDKKERKREQEEEEEVLEDGAFGPMNFDPDAEHVLQCEKAWKEQAAEKKKNKQMGGKEVRQKVTQTPHVYVPPPVYKKPTISCIPVGVKCHRLQDAHKSSYWVNQPFRGLIRVTEENHTKALDAWLDKVCPEPKTKYTPEEIQANADLHVRSELAKIRGEPPIEWRPLPPLVNPLHIPWINKWSTRGQPVAGEAEANGSAPLTAEESPTTVNSNNEGAKGPEVAENPPASPAWICPWNELGEELSEGGPEQELSEGGPEQDGMESRFFSVEDGDDWLCRQENIRAEFQEMEENYEDNDDDVPGPSNRFY